MSKISLAWVLVIVSALGIGVGVSYYVISENDKNKTRENSLTILSVPDSQTSKSNDDTKRKKLEGIGNTKNLKPVPLP